MHTHQEADPHPVPGVAPLGMEHIGYQSQIILSLCSVCVYDLLYGMPYVMGDKRVLTECSAATPTVQQVVRRSMNVVSR